MTCDSLKSSNYITLSNFSNFLLLELFSKFTAPIFIHFTLLSIFYASSNCCSCNSEYNTSNCTNK